MPGVRDMKGDGPDAGLPAVAGPNELNGTALLGWGRICLEGLQQRREEINALNVFPIADADTGTNMLATMRAAMQAADAAVISARGAEQSDGFAGCAVNAGAVGGVEESDAEAVGNGAISGAGADGGVAVSQSAAESPGEFTDRVIARRGIDRPNPPDLAGRGSSRNGLSAAQSGGTADGYLEPGAFSTHDVAAAMARGATLGARGNSGIILSQVLRGIAEAARGGPLTAQTLRDALATASALVRESLSVPVEGTILTVLERAAECAAASPESTLADVAVAAADGAAEALGDTPTQLGVLREAGVVDAGARGLVVLLDSLVAVTLGRTPDRPAYARGEFAFEASVDRATVPAHTDSAPRTDAEPRGTCAEPLNSAEPHFEVMYLLSDTDDRRIARLRDRLADLGDSVVVVGDGAGSWSAHVHCADAGAAVEVGIATGTLSAIRIESFTITARPTPAHYDAAAHSGKFPLADFAHRAEVVGHRDAAPADVPDRTGTAGQPGGAGRTIAPVPTDAGHRDPAPAADVAGRADGFAAGAVGGADAVVQPGRTVAGRPDGVAADVVGGTDAVVRPGRTDVSTSVAGGAEGVVAGVAGGADAVGRPGRIDVSTSVAGGAEGVAADVAGGADAVVPPGRTDVSTHAAGRADGVAADVVGGADAVVPPGRTDATARTAAGRRDGTAADGAGQADDPGQPGGVGCTDAPARAEASDTTIGSGATAPIGPDHDGPADRAVLAVASGDGAAALFEAGGAVVLGGDGAVTSAALLSAIRRLPNREVLVLPNGALPAHELVAVGVAARDAHRDVLLLPSGSMVQGLAALAVHDCGRIAVDDAFAMSEAAAATRWGSLRAATERALTMVGTCEAGDGLGLVGHDVVVIDRDVPTAGRTLLDRMLAFGGELVTLLMGAAAPDELADELATHIANGFPGVEVSVYSGGQQADLVQIGVE
ncbi:DAK2 domain-containing protein [Nocardia sp. CA-135953]|uniref:DAK2 domain-containing protein n=1 Tax=Nocardia sp. CA-135953 TaxID=3239978 RepID=UPI003D9882DA